MNVLEGKRVLIVEDEFLIAMTAADMIGEFGAVVVGPATTVRDALDLASNQKIDVALLDLNLHGQSSAVVADALEARHIPIVFATGYARGHDNRPDRCVLSKPYTQEKLVMKLCSALEASSAGA